jgi:hypothetical protein
MNDFYNKRKEKMEVTDLKAFIYSDEIMIRG